MEKRENLPSNSGSELVKKTKDADTLSLDAIPVEMQERVGRIIATHAQYEGPLPPPALFRDYGAVVPDAPERILKQFEANSNHFRETSTNALKAEISVDRRAQWMAFFLVIAGIGSAIYLAERDHTVVAVSVVGTLLIAVLVNFLGHLGKPAAEPSQEKKPERKKLPRRK